MSTTETNCRMVREIWLEEATGRPLTTSERTLVEHHLERCADCRREAGTAALVAFDGTPGPAPELDELAQRRWVDQVIDRAEEADRRPSSVDLPEPRSAAVYRIGFWAAAAAVALVAVGAVVWLAVGRTADEPGQPAPVAETGIAALEGQVLLAAGDVRLGGEHLAGIAPVEAGAAITVGSGRAVFDLSTGVTLLVDDHSGIEIAALDGHGIEVRLVHGRVMAEVDPARQGPPFAVSTRAGRVVVTGTAFSVAADDDQVEVRVFRGSVKVDGEAIEPRQVRVGESAVLGRAGVSRLSEDDKGAAAGLLRALDMLAVVGSARMDIQSLPAGATVMLDGVVLGQTPFAASIRSGHRSLELELDGYETVRELLELAPESRASRVFDLVGEAVPVAVESGSGGAGEARPHKPAKVDEPAPEEPAAALGPAELLARAQGFRVARDWASAVAAYQELIKQYPKSAEARSSLVSIGDIQLDHLRRPGKALKSFDSYLARTRKGTLAQEAAFGRARALRALGRTAEEIRALESFLAEFPAAIQAARAQQRLDELR